LLDSFGLPDTRNANPLSLSLSLSLSLGIHKTPPSSKFKAVAAALIGNKNRIKTPGQPPDISTAFKTAAALEDDNEENNKIRTQDFFQRLLPCVFFPATRRISSNLSHTTTMAPASKPGKLLYRRRRKEKNRSTNINEEPHLVAPLRAFLLTNLKPQ